MALGATDFETFPIPPDFQKFKRESIRLAARLPTVQGYFGGNIEHELFSTFDPFEFVSFRDGEVFTLKVGSTVFSQHLGPDIPFQLPFKDHHPCR